VRAFGRVIPFAGHSAVKFPDPRRVEDSDIKYHYVIIEVHGERLKALLEEPFAGVIVGKIDGIKAMPAIPAISGNRGWPASATQPGDTCLSPLQGCSVFGVRGADACWSHWIKVQWEPVAVHNIVVARGRSRAVLEAIGRTGVQGRVAGIECGVNARSFAAPPLGSLYEGLHIFEVPRHRLAWRIQDAQFRDRASPE
jgi:hypothetical protein